MARYRVYADQFDGNFDGYETLSCNDDGEALFEAQRLANNTAVEVWSGERFVTWLGKPSRTEQAREVVEEYANDLREIQKEFRRKLN